jgi:hypothetical protein
MTPEERKARDREDWLLFWGLSLAIYGPITLLAIVCALIGA